jgi:hypothetical protein
MNRSLANRTKVVSKVARAVSKAADNRSRAKRASSQDKAASRVVNRSLGKAVNRLNAEFWLVAYEGRRSNAVERRPHSACGHASPLTTKGDPQWISNASKARLNRPRARSRNSPERPPAIKSSKPKARPRKLAERFATRSVA